MSLIWKGVPREMALRKAMMSIPDYSEWCFAWTSDVANIV